MVFFKNKIDSVNNNFENIYNNRFVLVADVVNSRLSYIYKSSVENLEKRLPSKCNK